MPIPPFNEFGYLPGGLHGCSARQFFERFVTVSPERDRFSSALTDVLDFSKEKNAQFIFVGGSFASAKRDPEDIDLVLVFPTRDLVPKKGERLAIFGCRLDVMFCSQDDADLVNSFLKLLGTTRAGRQVGVLQIDLFTQGAEWEVLEPEPMIFEAVKFAYTGREYINLDMRRGILVTLHGIRTHADWNGVVTAIASSQSWTVAPFLYGFTEATVLASSTKQREILDKFRNWIFELREDYEGGISVLAHSFGTYLVAAYLQGFNDTPVKFDSIILTGSIISTKFEWGAMSEKIRRVRNEIAPNDEWVKFMPEFKLPLKNSLFGRSGVDGFASTSPLLEQDVNGIFGHNNVINKDVITTKWMPFLNANRSVCPPKEIVAYKRRVF